MDTRLENLEKTLLVLDRGMTAMYELVMENHKRLNRLEKEFLALEKEVKSTK
jgi:hypothetical protein